MPTITAMSDNSTGQNYWEYDAAEFIYIYPSIFLLVLGTLGNLLSFSVFSQETMRQSVTSLYFRVLAITDTVILLNAAPVFFMVGAFDYDIRLEGIAACKFFVSLLVISCYYGCWLLVLISIDRFTGVYFPHKYKIYCSQKRAVISMVLLAVVTVLSVGLFKLIVMDITNHETDTCGVSPKYAWFFESIYQWLDLTLLNILPTAVMVTLNVAMIIKISRSASKRQDFYGNTKETTKPKMNSSTAILLSVALVYFLCTIPSSTAFLVIRAFEDSGSPRADAQVLLYVRFCDILYLVNHSANFLLYCLHGSGFKKELKSLFKRKTPLKASRTQSNDLTMSTSLSIYSQNVN